MTGVTSRSGSGLMLFTLACLLLLCGVPGISAHNWLSSPARANDGGLGQFNGNTAPPCPPKTGRIHAQVAAGQAFPVEWATGHGFGSFTYLAVIKASDEQFLRQLDERTMDMYLAQAPSTNYLSDPKYQLYHVTNNGPSNERSLARDVTTTMKPQRPSIFRRERDPRFYEKQFAAVKDNKRAQYFNPRFPYIISVHKFALNEDKPDEMDFVYMEIPRGSPPGQYVVQYQWRGFNDCMDVNVLNVESTDIWGSKGPAENVFDKYHHTIFNPQLPGYSAEPRQGQQGCMVIPEGQTVKACQDLCSNRNTKIRLNNGEVDCDAITVAPAQLDRAIVKFPGLHKSLTSHLPASCDTVVANIAAANRPTAQVCFIQKSGPPPSVGPATKTVSDPEDSVFYMTTYSRKGNWVFAQQCDTCNPPTPPSDFRFADRCISCADLQRNFFSTLLPPRWTIQNTCQHCDNRLG